MSERKGDDAVRVPIEIKTEDLSELQQLIQELTEAEEAARTARASGAALPSNALDCFFPLNGETFPL